MNQASFLFRQKTPNILFSLRPSLLVKEASNDPIKRADTVRDIVIRHWQKFLDRIKKEITYRVCSDIEYF